MTDLIARFESEFQEYHGISAERRKEQVKVIRSVAEYSEVEYSKVEPSHVRAWLGAELARGLSPTTINKRLMMLRSWWKWLWQVKEIDANTLLELQAVDPPRGGNAPMIPRPYSRKELDAFYEALDKRLPRVEKQYWKRWRKGTSPFKRIQREAMRIQIEAIVALALQCGMRRAEIFQASIDHIHHDNAYVVVKYGKGGKEREVPHTRASRAAVKAWLDLRAELNPKHDKVWLSLAYERVARNPMRWDRFRELLRKQVGEYQYHRFRHTAGTEWLRAIQRIEIVSKLLGHSRIQQTQAYAEIISDDLHQAVNKAELKFEKAVGAR